LHLLNINLPLFHIFGTGRFFSIKPTTIAMHIFKSTILFFTLLIGFTACQKSRPNYSAEQHLTKAEQNEFTYSIIRYLGKLPGKANHQTKFDASFDDAYRKTVAAHNMWFYFKEESSQKQFFLFTRIAPSIKQKYVAIGGYVVMDDAGQITDYEEVFRTWKMPEPELREKALLLFDLMVKQKDLSPYLPQNSGSEEFIEFPDPNVFYNKEQRIWESTLEDYMEPLYHNMGHPLDTAIEN
jgi:hypothetical protein